MSPCHTELGAAGVVVVFNTPVGETEGRGRAGGDILDGEPWTGSSDGPLKVDIDLIGGGGGPGGGPGGGA